MFQRKLLIPILNNVLKYNSPTSSKKYISHRTQLVSVQKFQNLCTKVSTEVKFEEIKSLQNDKNVLLIDVREPSELQETGVIPGSINIPLGNIEKVLQNMSAEEFKKCYGRPKPKIDFPLIFSCRKGSRSTEAQNLAQKLGYTNVRNYLGGWTDWEEKVKS